MSTAKSLLLTLFIAVLLANSVVVTYVVPVSASSECKILAERIVDPSKTEGEEIEVKVNISDVIHLFTWEFKLGWKKSVLRYLSASQGEFLKSGGSTFFTSPIVNSSAGYVLLSCTLTGQVEGVTGNGTLVSIRFEVESTGYSVLDLFDTKLLMPSPVPPFRLVPIDHQSEDGWFSNQGQPSLQHDIAVTEVTASPGTVFAGQNVSIAVSIENQGDYWETFDVTTYYDANPIETRTGVSLGINMATITITFIWNTAIVDAGTYTISAEADPVLNESDTADNTLIDGTVEVKHLGTEVYVDPLESSCNPPWNFTINVKIVNVESLYAWQLELEYNASVLFTEKAMVVVDPEMWFNQSGGIPSSPAVNVEEGKIQVSASLSGENSTDGSGTLVRVTFKVEKAGNCTLDLLDTILLDPYSIEIPHTAEGGYFYTKLPVAIFTYLPHHPRPSDILTFDASPCYDPDDPYDSTPGGILSYQWDFGDEATENGAIVTHKFNASLTPYVVNLTVTDDDGEISYFAKDVFIWSDVAVVLPNSTFFVQTYAGQTINLPVWVSNEGSAEETFTVAVYYNETNSPVHNWTEIGSQQVTQFSPNSTTMLTFMWNTTGVPLCYIAGNYTIMANITSAPDEIDIEDNALIVGLVEVRGEGDINGDKKVGYKDLFILSSAYGSSEGDPKYNQNADLNSDGKINYKDLFVLSANYGKEY